MARGCSRSLALSVAAALVLPLVAASTSDMATATMTSTPVTTTAMSATSPPITTAPVYLPYYDQFSWSAMRGSIVGVDDKANRTTYTAFCPKQSTDACNLALQFPFVFVEGPKTVEFHGTYTSTYIANVACNLKGHSEATCSGSTSLASDFTMGSQTGPTEISWTSTFTGTDVQWGALTLTEPPSITGGSKDNEPMPTAELTNSALYYMTKDSSAAKGMSSKAGALSGVVALLVGVLVV